MAATKRKEAMAANRDKLLAHAKALFTARGYEAVGVRDVAAAAGVSTGAVFSQFSGKIALYEAAMGTLSPEVARFLYGASGQ